MEDKNPKIHWVSQDNLSTAYANALGYNSHNASLKKACAEYFDFDEGAPVAITITPADKFKPVPGKFNILFTMWECLDVPACYLPGLNSADLIIVPCEFCREVFAPLTNKPIVVCHEGADPDVFQFKERKFPDESKGERFRYLWLGAPNPRKGYFSVLELVKALEQFPNIEIYFKTTANKKLAFFDLCKVICVYFKKREWKKLKASVIRYLNPRLERALIVHGKHKNIFFDSRKLSQQELVDLYHSAHCFVAPHCGEGWGLTLCEAMATGCPSIASYSTGVLDFFNYEVGYPVKCITGPVDLQNYNIKARVFVPDTNDFFQKVLLVYQNYREALRRGRKAAYHIKTSFTWKKSAKRMADIVSEYYPKERVEDAESLSVQESKDRECHGACLECAEV